MADVFTVSVGKIEPVAGLPELNADLQQIAESEVAQVATLGAQALQTSSPVYTGALRNSVVVEGSAAQKSVLIEDTSHYSGYSTSELADILDQNPFKRSQQSVSAGPFKSIARGSSTAGWIEKAQNDLETYL